jgi:predicted RNase H-like HicB family nuclease
MTINAFIEWDPETKLYVGIVPGIRGAHTQAKTLDELDRNLKEVVELCYEENSLEFQDLPKYVGVHQLEVNV